MGNCCCGGSSAEKFRSESAALEDAMVSELQTSPSSARIVVAVYSYRARDSQDLSFHKGDRMQVQEESDDDWLFVKHLASGKKGYVPGNFVAPELSVESEDWFFENTSRKEAVKLLLDDDIQPVGTFLVRPSEHNPHGYSLSVKDWESHRGYHVKHYKIKPLDHGGFYVSTNMIFDSLVELVLEHTQHAHGLCHALAEPCRKPPPLMWDLAPTYRDIWEINRDEIQLCEKLGGGNFGDVFYGMWKNQQEVAVKTLREGTMSTEAFLREAGIMKKFRHKRLVQLYGVCSTTKPIYIVQEFMEKGNLLEFFKCGGKTLEFSDLVFIAFQVASGMAHLESLNYIHRDLAARNVLIGKNNVAKVADFGLARILENPIYVASSCLFPAKWTAPEAFASKTFTIKSDVWSYGVFLTELFSYGGEPYKGVSPTEVLGLVSTGYRMPKPANLPDEIYETMSMCWHHLPDKRPSFKSLEKYFEEMEVSYKTNAHSNIVLSHVTSHSYEDHEPKFNARR